MKKILSLLLSAFMILSNTCVVFADENVELYAYTANTDEFDHYAQEEIANHLYTYYGYNNDFELGQGIFVFGNTNNPLVIYPIWDNSQIIGTFKVAYINGQYSGSYSEGNVEQLNYAINLTSNNNPMKLFKTDEKLLYIINDVVYNAAQGIGLVEQDIDADLVSFEDGYIVNARTNLQYEQMKNARYTTNYELNWSFSGYNPSAQCYAFALAGMLQNLGYTSYTKDTVARGICQLMGHTIILPSVDFRNVTNYLTDQGFTFLQMSTGYLSKVYVLTNIYDYRTYIMIGLSFSGTDGNHFAVIYGYNNSGSTYKVYDPAVSANNGKCTMTASSRSYTHANGQQLVWDAGYITRVTK